MKLCHPAVCLLCSETISSEVVNHALGDYAEEHVSKTETNAPEQSESSAAKTDNVDEEGEQKAFIEIREMLASFAKASEKLTAAADVITAKVEDVAANSVTCTDKFNQKVDKLIQSVEGYRKYWLGKVEEKCAERVKTLEAQANTLLVSAGQLEACIEMGNAAIDSKKHANTSSTLQSLKASKPLLETITKPCLDTRLKILHDSECVMKLLEKSTTLRDYGFNAEKSFAVGSGLICYNWGFSILNTFEVRCVDADEFYTSYVSPDDLTVELCYADGTNVGDTIDIAQIGKGIFRVNYTVGSGTTGEAIHVGVSVCGQLLNGKPFVVHEVCRPRGIFVKEISIPDSIFGNFALAVDNNGLNIAVTNELNNNVDVYSVETGLPTISFGGYGSNPGRLSAPGGICTSPKNTLLIADSGNRRVQEFSWEGSFLRSMGSFDEGIEAIACHGTMLAVGNSSICDTINVTLLNYLDGTVLRSFGTFLEIRGLQFSLDGKRLIVLQVHSTAEYSLDGDLISSGSHKTKTSKSNQYGGMVLLQSGNLVLTEALTSGSVSVFAPNGSFIRQWNLYDHGISKRSCFYYRLAQSETNLFILDRNKILMFQ